MPLTPGLPAAEIADLIAAQLRQEGALLSGHFKLSSGLHSDTYVQCARFLRRPELAEPACAALAEQLRAAGLRPDVVVGPAMGGIVIGYELARQLGVPGIFTERDADGKMSLRRGFTLSPGERASVRAHLEVERIPLTKRWWFWASAAGVLATAAVVTYAVTRPTPEPVPYDGGSAGWVVQPR